MSDNDDLPIRLNPATVVSRFVPPAALDASEIRRRLDGVVQGTDSALAFPLTKVILPGDSVAVPIFGHVQDAAPIAAGFIAALISAGIPETSIRAICRAEEAAEYRSLLPAGITVVGHDPGVEEASAYLANTRRGTRVYVNRELLDCDVILPVIVPDPTGPDTKFGLLRGFWPEFARAETRSKLEADFRENPRQVRHEIREVAWLAGVPAVIAGLPGSDGCTDLAAVPAADLQAWAYPRLNELWGFDISDSADSVLLIANCPEGLTERRARSLFALARKLAVRYRRLVIWCDLGDAVSDAMEIESNAPPGTNTPWLNTLKKIGRSASVSFLGNLADDIADDCDIVLLDEPEDVDRQISRSGRWIVVGQAWGVRARFSD